MRFTTKVIFFTPVSLLLLAVSVACGGSAAATPVTQPTATTAAAQQAQPTAAADPQAQPTAMSEATPTAGLPTSVFSRATPTAVPAVPAAMVTSKTNRLNVVLGPVNRTSNLPWIENNHGSESVHEYLVGIEHTSGKLIPELAEEWGVSADGKTWTFNLRKGVQFHHGWGEFTSKDVAHMVAMSTQEGSRAVEKNAYKEIIENVELVDDYTVKIHQNVPDAFIIEFYTHGGHGSSVITSKKRWDEAGLEAYENQMIGTGPWQFLERDADNAIVAERVENHWRVTPEFEEIRFLRSGEEATRLAGLLAGEVQIATLPRDLDVTAAKRGMKIWYSILPAVQYGWFFGGQHYGSDQTDKLKAGPFVGLDENARKVRQAINKGIDRQEIVDTLFAGRAEKIRAWAYHPSLLGYNPEWEGAKWEELYAYDPERARELLAEAGYADGFDVQIALLGTTSVPEQIPALELLGSYMQEIGLNVEFVQMDGAQSGDRYRGLDYHGFLFPVSGTYRDPQFGIRVYNDPATAIVHSFETDFIHDKYQQLIRAVNADDRSRLMREIGDHKFENIGEIPLVWFPASAAVDPAVVKEFHFPGKRRRIWTDFAYIKAADPR